MSISEAIGRELIYVTCIARSLWLARHIHPDARLSIAHWTERWAVEKPDAPAILCQDRVLSWFDVDQGANRYARWTKELGLKKGDVVALFMDNRPEYILAWLGLIKRGIVAALVNTHLTGLPLSHTLAMAGARHIILGDELSETYATAIGGLEARPVPWLTGGARNGFQDLDAALARQSGAPLKPEEREDVFCRDKAFYIYTSGTTGLPKAANISHMRLLHIMTAFPGAVNGTPEDRMYVALPLYHSAGGIAALGPAFLSGGSVVIRSKFSAGEFWDDCHRYRPTLFQYIGELCRYLLNAPPHPLERSHYLRIAVGNGLRPEIWARFQARFQIPRIMEFYGATEGNVGMINYDGKVGAIGRLPWYVRRILRVRLIKFDVEKVIALRGPGGFCVETDDNEVGEAIGEIDPNDPRSRFDGYTSTADTEKKILRSAFKPGDAWFRTGDLMRRDRHGYFYFVDRTGDTFRWKGENVATSEVAEVLSVFPGILEANVYGVEVPGVEGKAGMAALVTGGDFDLSRMPEYLGSNLPSFARPVFLRFQQQMEITSTFKQRKLQLQQEGFDPAVISDALWFRDPATGKYQRLMPELYREICGGKLKL